MKLLTLNTNSLVQQNSDEKLAVLCETIAQGSYDVIALQEINQMRGAADVSLANLEEYVPCQDRVPVKSDNYALSIIEALRASGQDWEWTWLPTHVGWDKYDEGIALLTRHPIRKTNAFFLSGSHDYANPKTRMALGIQTEFNGKREWYYTVHFGRWDDNFEPFRAQWDRFLQNAGDTAAPVYVMGDFNNDAGVAQQGYDYILASSNLYDSYTQAEYHDSGITVGDYIFGWSEKDHPKEMRIDFIFTNTDLPVLSSEIVFNGKNRAVVSDHFGLEVTFGEKLSTFKTAPGERIPEFASKTAKPAPLSVQIRAGMLTPVNRRMSRIVLSREPFYRYFLERSAQRSSVLEDMLEILNDDKN